MQHIVKAGDTFSFGGREETKIATPSVVKPDQVWDVAVRMMLSRHMIEILPLVGCILGLGC